MSDMFESLELNMREEADRVNPTKAIMASQLECEKRFEGFVAKNPERIDFIADDIRSVADKYAAQYDISSDTVYEATVSHLKEAAVKQANPRDPFAGKDEAHSDLINDYVGYNMDLDQIEAYWNQYKPLLESALQGTKFENGVLVGRDWTQEQGQLEAELEHLKSELDGIDGGEEGSERYWALEEQISKALTALYDSGVDHSLDEAAQNTDIGEPMTSETQEFRMGSTQQKAASVADQRLATFLTAHQDVLFPELTKLGLTWQDMLQRSNLWGNKINPDNVWGWGQQKAQQEDSETQEAPTPMGVGDENPTQEFPAVNRAPKRNPATGQLDGPQENLINPEDYTQKDLLEADRKTRENALKRQQMYESEPATKTRGPYKGEYLRGASVLQDALVNYYVSTGMPQRTASILVEAVGEMAQLQQDSPGLPIADSEPKNVNPDTAIGGKEGDKYQNWDVADKQKGLDAGHQDFTDFGEPTREFIQPGGEAPYSENTKKDIFEGAEQSKMDAKRVKQDDNAPKKSSVKSSNMSVEEIKARIKEIEGYTKRDLSAGEAFGPDHGQDDAAYDELHDLKQLLKEKTEDAPKTSARSGLRGMFTDLQIQSIRNHYEDGEGKISPSLLEKCKRLGLCGEDGQFTDKFKQMLDQHVENSGNGPEKLKSLFTLGSEQSAKKSNASVKEAMARRFPLNPEYEDRAREIVNAYIERDLKNNEHEEFRGYLPGFEYDQDFYSEANKRELENDAVHAIMGEFGVSSDTDENFDFNQLVDWVSEIVLDSPIGQNIDLTRGFNQKMKNTGLWGN